MKPYLLQVESVKQNLREDFLYLTEVLLKKTIPHANKQLQDTLTKYFLENYVSDLLKDKMRKSNNRAVFQEISSTISSGRPKYLKLLNAFEDKIKFYQLDSQYNNMLLILILDVGRHPRESEEWRTHTRKRMLSLLLYVHWNEQEKRDEFQSFFEMWKVAYPENPLPQRQFKNPKIHSFDQKNMYSSQSLEEDSLYNQKNNNNGGGEMSNDEMQQLQPTKSKKIKTNKNEPHSSNTLQQKSEASKPFPSAAANGISSALNFGTSFGLNSQQNQQLQNSQQQQANNIILQQQPHSFLNQNIIKNHANQSNGFRFNAGNNLSSNTNQIQSMNQAQQSANLFSQNNKNESELNQNQQQQIFNQHHKNYFNNQSQIGNRDFIINTDNQNFNSQIKNNPIKQESTEDNNNSTDNQNQQQSFLQEINPQNPLQLNQNGENNLENQLNNQTNSMFFTNSQNITNQNPFMALNGGQNYSNFFQNGPTQSQYFQQGISNNFLNYNGGAQQNIVNPIGNSINNSIINMTSSFNQFNQQGNNIGSKITDSQNFINLNPEKQILMDSSYNNELILAASQNLNQYQNNPQNISLLPISIVAAMQNMPNNRGDANNNLTQNMVNNLNHNNNGNNQFNSSSKGNQNQANQKKNFTLNQSINQGNSDANDISPIKIEQQNSFLQQQQAQLQQNSMYQNQYFTSKLLQNNTDSIQNFNKARFNMGQSVTNMNQLQNNSQLLNSTQLNCNLQNMNFFNFQNEIYSFFQQYYSEPKEEISWESTEPLYLYQTNQAPLMNDINSILPVIQQIKEGKSKFNINNAKQQQNQQSNQQKEKENEEISEVDSYEVQENPVSQ
ncbi:hypothetical protein ABPG74_014727 [Tetrahymena malaccensis]